MKRVLDTCVSMIILMLTILLLACSAKPIQSDISKDKSAIKLATWNIGYFSNGVSGISTIKSSDYNRQLKRYRSLIYDSIHPDIISINEYNRVFIGKDKVNNMNVTASLLFDQFSYKIIGPKKGFHKALFSKLKLRDKYLKYFNCHKSFEKDEDIKNTTSYYIETTININNKKVKLVNVHLMFSKKISGVIQQMQIEELIKAYGKCKRVVIFGDFNTGNYSLLKKAGYTLANDGSLVTFPKKGTPLDNIAAKGLLISEVRVIKTDLSDHYSIVCKISID